MVIRPTSRPISDSMSDDEGLFSPSPTYPSLSSYQYLSYPTSPSSHRRWYFAPKIIKLSLIGPRMDSFVRENAGSLVVMCFLTNFFSAIEGWVIERLGWGRWNLSRLKTLWLISWGAKSGKEVTYLTQTFVARNEKIHSTPSKRKQHIFHFAPCCCTEYRGDRSFQRRNFTQFVALKCYFFSRALFGISFCGKRQHWIPGGTKAWLNHDIWHGRSVFIVERQQG